MNKLDAMRTLANAWHYLTENYAWDTEAEMMLHDKFHQLRRSLSILELDPRKCAEGYNGKGPAYL